MKHDGLGAARNLDRTIGIAGVDDVRGIRTGAERRGARDEFERPPALETVADAIRCQRHLPFVIEEMFTRGLGYPMPVKPGHDTQLSRHRQSLTEVSRY